MARSLWVHRCLLLIALFAAAGCRAPNAVTPPAQPVPPKQNLQPSQSGQQGQVNPLFDSPRGIGMMGDSFYDEYRGTDQRGGQYASVTFNLVELLARNRGFHFGAWGEWGEPRREGYQYNWARSGATSSTMIEMGQHTALAEQISRGFVSFVFIGIGSNDFSPYYGDFYERIYNGTMSDEELAAKVTRAVEDVTLAVDTVQDAGVQGVAIVLFMQWELDPTIAQLYPDAQRRQRVAAAIDSVNAGLAAMAAERGAAVVDQAAIGASMGPHFDAEGKYKVGNERIDFINHGDEPHHSRLADGQHVGTVMGGVAANYYFIDTLNQHFQFSIPRLTDEEILREAGLRP